MANRASYKEILEQEFGGEALTALREKEAALKDGIPGADGVAFSERINMRDKLHQLEVARDYLVDKCPADLQEECAIAKNPFLIRLAMEKVHPFYMTVIGYLTDKVKELKRHRKILRLL